MGRRLAPLFIEYAGLSGGGSILDVGCGTGSLTFAIGGYPGVTKVTGIDFSPVYIEYAKAQNQDPRIEFRTGDACALNADASFDHALSLLVLHFIPEPERAVREVRRVTRPGGVVCAAVGQSRRVRLATAVLGYGCDARPGGRSSTAKLILGR